MLVVASAPPLAPCKMCRIRRFRSAPPRLRTADYNYTCQLCRMCSKAFWYVRERRKPATWLRVEASMAVLFLGRPAPQPWPHSHSCPQLGLVMSIGNQEFGRYTKKIPIQISIWYLCPEFLRIFLVFYRYLEFSLVKIWFNIGIFWQNKNRFGI